LPRRAERPGGGNKRKAAVARLQAKALRAVLKGWTYLNGHDARARVCAALRALEERAQQ